MERNRQLLGALFLSAQFTKLFHIEEQEKTLYEIAGPHDSDYEE
jgi:hypothetical protein